MKGRENVYVCEQCGGFTVTVDIDDGVTPFMLGCRALGEEGLCEGLAYSELYPPGPRPPHIPAPAWEWYKPTAQELKASTPGMQAHAAQGGLFLRKRGELMRRKEQVD